MAELTIEQRRALAVARARQRQQQQAPANDPVVHRGRVLPVDRMESGDLQFNINSGLPGALIDALRLPGDVYTGKQPVIGPDGHTDPTLIERSAGAAALTTPMNPAVRAGGGWAGAAVTRPRPRTPSPTTEALTRAGGEGFEQSRNAGVEYSPQWVARLASEIMTGLERKGFLETNVKNTFAALKRLADLPVVQEGERIVADIATLHSARRSLNEAAKDFTNKSEQAAASLARAALDRFISEPPASAVVAGPAREAGRTFGDALGNYAAGARSAELVGREQRALRRAGAANSGRNIDNTLRQRVADILDRPALRAGFNAEELALMEQFVRGTATRNAVRRIGNMLGGGGGLGQTVLSAIGGTLAAPLGPLGIAAGVVIPPVLGSGARTLANRMARGGVRQIDEAVRRRSPLYEQTPPMPPVMPNTMFLRGGLLAPQGGGGGY